MNVTKKRFLASVVAALALWMAPMAVHAVGISPVLIEAMGLLQNSSVRKEVYLTRSNPSKDEKGIVLVQGDAAPYIRLPNKGLLDLPKGMYNTPYEFFIEPGTLATGTYEVKIQVAPYSPGVPGESPAGSAVLTGAQATIRFSVTSDVVETFAVSNPSVRETEEGGIVDFTYQMNNTGNVDTRVGRIDVTIHDEHDPSFLYTESINQSQLKIVKALTADVDDVPTKAALSVGSYLMQVKFFKGEQEVFSSKELRFQVYPRGTLAQKGELISFVADKAQYENGEIVGFKAVFKNSGKIGYLASLGVSLYRGNAARVEVLDTESKFVAAGETMEFEKVYRPDQSGEYSAVAAVTYGPRKTDELRATFTVGSKISIWWVFFWLILLVIILALIIRKILKKLRKKQEISSTETQAPPTGMLPPQTAQVPTASVPPSQMPPPTPPMSA